MPNPRKLNPLIRLKAIWHVLKDRRTPLWAKGLFLVLTLLYIVWPIDLVPDVFLGLGWVDDLVMIPAMAWLTTRFAPKVVRSDAWNFVLRQRAAHRPPPAAGVARGGSR